ncbi:hypothetical protein [Rhodoglobus vestalii]|uniref:hypothetical protein n=1 Tax=Rhodoglobus vestalii TaxID=193384 RepID=UPI00114D5D1B|nr:hypothetical protein [Rhodoglobus vestalii]
MILVARSWDRFYEDTGLVGVILAVLAVLVPFALAVWLTSTCTAWNGSKEGRCQKRRPGWHRCEEPTHGRTRQFITLPEVAAVLSILISVANAVILITLAA